MKNTPAEGRVRAQSGRTHSASRPMPGPIPGLVGDQVPPVRGTDELQDLIRAPFCKEQGEHSPCQYTHVCEVPPVNRPTLAPSLQMLKLHPPTESRTSLKKGERSRQQTAPECSLKWYSGREAAGSEKQEA